MGHRSLVSEMENREHDCYLDYVAYIQSSMTLQPSSIFLSWTFCHHCFKLSRGTVIPIMHHVYVAYLCKCMSTVPSWRPLLTNTLHKLKSRQCLCFLFFFFVKTVFSDFIQATFTWQVQKWCLTVITVLKYLEKRHFSVFLGKCG